MEQIVPQRSTATRDGKIPPPPSASTGGRCRGRPLAGCSAKVGNAVGNYRGKTKGLRPTCHNPSFLLLFLAPPG